MNDVNKLEMEFLASIVSVILSIINIFHTQRESVLPW